MHARLRVLVVGLVLAMLSATAAYAADVSAPIEIIGHKIACSTCCTASGTLTSNGVLYGSGGKATAATAANASGHKQMLIEPSGSAPGFNDLDDLAALASGIKSGDGTKLATTTGDLTNGRCVQIDASGNFIQAAGACGAGAVIVDTINSEIPMTVLSATPVYMSPDCVSENEAECLVPVKSAATFTNLEAMPVSATTNAITLAMGTGACTGAMTYAGGVTVTMSTTALTVAASTGSSSVTAGQCWVLKATAGTNASKTQIRASVEKSA